MPWCIPLLAAAASVAGTGLQMAGAQKARDEANQRVNEELQRQHSLQQQAEQQYSVAKSQADAGTAQTGIKDDANQRLQQYQQVQQIPLNFRQPGTQIGKAVVNAKDAASMDLSNRARSALSGYDQWLLQRMIQQQQSGNLLGVTAGLARSSANVLPMELQSAQHAGDSLAGIGGLLGTAGSIASNYSASNGSLCNSGVGAASNARTTGLSTSF